MKSFFANFLPRFVAFALFGFASESQLQAKTVALLGQWHLLPKVKTLDIKESKKLAQFPNQKAIYLVLKGWINKKELDLILAEGCGVSEINHKFKENFHGWDYEKLSKASEKKDYEDLLTHLPLKLEAQFKEKILTVCADNMELVEKHQLSFSDLRGYAGFYVRLLSNMDNKKQFKKYLKALEELEGRRIENPISFSKKKISSLIELEKSLLEKRNKEIVNIIKSRQEENIALIIGYRHVKGLRQLLAKEKVKVVAPAVLNSTLPKEDPMKEFKKIIGLKVKKQVSASQ